MPRPGSTGALMRALIGLTAVLAVLVGQMSVGFAGHDGSRLAWIEICGEEGTHLAPVGGNRTPGDCVCTDCRCTLMGVGLKAVPAPATWQAGCAAGAVRARVMRQAKIVPDSPEQYWAATRGPPKQKASARMSSFPFPKVSKSSDRRTGMGERPCA